MKKCIKCGIEVDTISDPPHENWKYDHKNDGVICGSCNK